MENNDFAKLEAVVEKLLTTLSAARDENTSLITQAQDKDARIQELEQKIAALSSERTEIGSRVANLINSIENWQNTTAPASAPENEDTETPAPGLFGGPGEQDNG